MATTHPFSLNVSDTIGAVSAEQYVPKQMKAMMTLAHGAGAGMQHDFMVKLSRALADRDIGTVRFNFPFKEQGRGRPDSPAVAQATIAAALQYIAHTFPDTPRWASGKSFGGRMTSHLLATTPPVTIQGVIFYGFPLHPAGKPGTTRAAHLSSVPVPMLFLQGTRDALASWPLIESVCQTLPRATLQAIEGADHAFKAGKRPVIEELAEHTAHWIARIG